MNDYSQHGEGKIIADYFGDFKGHLVSLGENDGKTLSNVLGLIENGWSADLVEPSEQVFDNLVDLHKSNLKVSCMKIAISNKDGEVDFYESGTHLNKGDLSLLSSTRLHEISKWKKEKFTKTKVDCITWDSFIKKAYIIKADLISIDCEGLDFDILVQIDFDSLRTKCVCVEYNNAHKQKYVNHMNKFGFKLHYENFCNLIFVK